jgi:nickel superoxide dismutase
MKKLIVLGIAVLALAGVGRMALSHCEVPCGIYDDPARIALMKEDIATCEKAMNQMRIIAGHETPNMNQYTRWVANKESHAERIQHNVAQYWLTQRIKVPADGDQAGTAKYHRQLALLHQIMVKAMKMKQTTQTQHAADARKLVDEFAGTYFK